MKLKGIKIPPSPQGGGKSKLVPTRLIQLYFHPSLAYRKRMTCIGPFSRLREKVAEGRMRAGAPAPVAATLAAARALTRPPGTLSHAPHGRGIIVARPFSHLREKVAEGRMRAGAPAPVATTLAAARALTRPPGTLSHAPHGRGIIVARPFSRLREKVAEGRMRVGAKRRSPPHRRLSRLDGTALRLFAGASPSERPRPCPPSLRPPIPSPIPA